MNRLLWLILLIVWIAFGTWCCWTKVCGAGAVGGTDNGCSTWKILDGNRFSHDASTNVKFLKSSDDHISETEVDKALSSVSDYLKKNKSRVLTIVGYYSNSERNSNASFSNLGISRADDLRQHFIKSGVDANQLKTAGVEYNENCYEDNKLLRGARFMFGS